jgi:carotenoid 1,2-hydratase
VIAFIGSVFSPWYAWARRRGPAPAIDHCAMNVVLYGAGGKRWAMTERGSAAVHRSPRELAIGRSRMAWDGAALTIEVDEVTAPIPSRIRGTIRLIPAAVAGHVVSLDAGGCHGWSPIAPRARVEVALSHPGRSWRGDAYFDSNWGTRALERDFSSWTWARAPMGDGAAVIYDVARRDGTDLAVALRYGADGGAAPFTAPPMVAMRRSFWGLPRVTRSESTARVTQTLEDAPFYGRAVVGARWLGQDLTAMHENLSLDRFDTPWMRLMLPFKAPRAWPAARRVS